VPADPDDAPPADWYVDPDAPGRGRYWDGTRWTDDVVDIPEGLTLRSFASAGAPRERLGAVERWMLLGLVVGVVAFLLVIALTGRSERGDGGVSVVVQNPMERPMTSFMISVVPP
jgi:hypothetical protein